MMEDVVYYLDSNNDYMEVDYWYNSEDMMDYIKYEEPSDLPVPMEIDDEMEIDYFYDPEDMMDLG